MCLCLSWHLFLAEPFDLRGVDYQGCATCHRGRLVILDDAQCTQAYSSAERVDTASRLEPWHGLCPTCLQGGLLPKAMLAGAPWGLWILQESSACCCVALYCAGLSSVLPQLWVKDARLA